MKLQARVDKFLRSQRRAWEHDRSKTLGASEAFGCLRRAFYEKFLPHEAEPGSLGAAHRGNVIEQHFTVPLVYDLFGRDKVHFAGDDQKTFFTGKVSCTPDGLAVGAPEDFFVEDGLPRLTGGAYGLEFKSADPRKDTSEPDAQHVGQAQLQLDAYHKHTPYRPDYAVILYTDASFFDTIVPHAIKYDPTYVVAAQERAEQLFAATSPTQIFAEGALTGACDICPYQNACKGAVVRDVVPVQNPLGDNAQAVLDDLMREYTELRPRVDTESARVQELSQLIADLLSENRTNAVTSDAYKIRVSVVKGRQTISKEAVEKYIRDNGLDRAEFVTNGSPYRRTVITLKTEKPESK
jgi:hypothetical protein